MGKIKVAEVQLACIGQLQSNNADKHLKAPPARSVVEAEPSFFILSRSRKKEAAPAPALTYGNIERNKKRKKN